MSWAESWTQDTAERAAAMWKAGSSARDIGIEIGRSRNAVIGKVHRMGLRRPERGVGLSAAPRQQKKQTNSAGPSTQRQASRTAVVELTSPAAADISGLFLAIALVDLQQQHCRYPGNDRPVSYCGQNKLNGSSYCVHHHRLCHGGWR